jgi:Ser/Thr protein kinase RdoA (MazF antagonist)
VKSNDENEREKLLAWLPTALGPFEILSDHTREHPGERAAAIQLRIPQGVCYVKIHPDWPGWESEVHGYEQWARAFGDFAPRLVAVRDEPPLALVISELPGKILEEVQLEESLECTVWHTAAKALSGLHKSAQGDWFGPCRRDGTCAATPVFDAQAYVTKELDDWLARGLRVDALSKAELTILHSARGLIPAFAGERPTACHRDYCPANWLVNSAGLWTGVIDFEFAYWDVWVSDFARNPAWDWIHHPDRINAFIAGYGRPFTLKEEQQLLFAHALYALSAIVWGEENAYHGFAEGGRQSLKMVGDHTKQ